MRYNKADIDHRERAEAQMRYNKADNDHRLMRTDQRCPGPIRTPQKIIDSIFGQSAAAVAASSSSSTDEGQRVDMTTGQDPVPLDSQGALGSGHSLATEPTQAPDEAYPPQTVPRTPARPLPPLPEHLRHRLQAQPLIAEYCSMREEYLGWRDASDQSVAASIHGRWQEAP